MERGECGGGAAGDAELAVEGSEAVADAAVGEAEVRGDGLVVQAATEEGEDVALAGREGGAARGGGIGGVGRHPRTLPEAAERRSGDKCHGAEGGRRKAEGGKEETGESRKEKRQAGGGRRERDGGAEARMTNFEFRMTNDG